MSTIIMTIQNIMHMNAAAAMNIMRVTIAIVHMSIIMEITSTMNIIMIMLAAVNTITHPTMTAVPVSTAMNTITSTAMAAADVAAVTITVTVPSFRNGVCRLP